MTKSELDKLENRLNSCVVIHLVGPNCNMSCEPETILSLIAEVRKLREVLSDFAGISTDFIPTDHQWHHQIMKARVALSEGGGE